MPKKNLVTVQELAAHPEWRVIDCRHDLSQPAAGAARYAQGHLPGAVHAHLDDNLSGAKTGTNGRHPLPDAMAFSKWLGHIGIRPGDRVVAYDDAPNAFAARFWWLLKWAGHENVAVLDGGIKAWVGQGHALTTDTPSFAPTAYPVQAACRPTVDAALVAQGLARGERTVLDARGAGRYAGEGETIDPVAGHIPGALNRPFMDNVDADGRFKPAEVLRAEFDALIGVKPASHVVAQCGSGVTACHNLLAMEIAGLPGASLYPGSWSEWCSDSSRPVATGSAP